MNYRHLYSHKYKNHLDFQNEILLYDNQSAVTHLELHFSLRLCVLTLRYPTSITVLFSKIGVLWLCWFFLNQIPNVFPCVVIKIHFKQKQFRLVGGAVFFDFCTVINLIFCKLIITFFSRYDKYIQIITNSYKSILCFILRLKLPASTHPLLPKLLTFI